MITHEAHLPGRGRTSGILPDCMRNQFATKLGEATGHETDAAQAIPNFDVVEVPADLDTSERERSVFAFVAFENLSQDVSGSYGIPPPWSR